MNGPAIGFNQGQFGDLCMSTVAARAFKSQFPDTKLILGINKKYESIKEIFTNNAYFDGIHIWDGYDNWPTEEDKRHMLETKYSKVFNPMPHHTDSLWYLKSHQTEELCLMHGLTPPSDLTVSLNENHLLIERGNYIAVSFSGVTRGEAKSISLDKAKVLCSLIKEKFGLEAYQIGLPEESSFSSSRFSGSFIDSIKFMLGAKLLVTIDTSWAWIASGYAKPTLGLYSSNYYSGAKTAKNWQPINRNAIYLESENVNDINQETILNEISRLL